MKLSNKFWNWMEEKEYGKIINDEGKRFFFINLKEPLEMAIEDINEIDIIPIDNIFKQMLIGFIEEYMHENNKSFVGFTGKRYLRMQQGEKFIDLRFEHLAEEANKI